MSGHRNSAFEAGKKLRDIPIEFVSAGLLEGTIKERKPLSVHELGSESDDESVAPSSSLSVSPPDTTKAMAQMTIRSPSPAASEVSSECSDQVVFRGRGNTSVPLSTTTSRVESPLPEKQAVAIGETVNNVIEKANARAQSIAAQVAGSASIPVADVHVQPKVNVSVRVKGIVRNQ